MRYWNLKDRDIPKDEKFHIMKVGAITVENDSAYFYGAVSWLLNCVLRGVYQPNAGAAANSICPSNSPARIM